jgi:hypothetical protein
MIYFHVASHPMVERGAEGSLDQQPILLRDSGLREFLCYNTSVLPKWSMSSWLQCRSDSWDSSRSSLDLQSTSLRDSIIREFWWLWCFNISELWSQ